MAKVTIVNKSAIPLHGVQPGAKIKIEVDEHGTPFDLHWRRRFRDAKIDNCVEIVKEVKEKKKTIKQEDKI